MCEQLFRRIIAPLEDGAFRCAGRPCPTLGRAFGQGAERPRETSSPESAPGAGPRSEAQARGPSRPRAGPNGAPQEGSHSFRRRTPPCDDHSEIRQYISDSRSLLVVRRRRGARAVPCPAVRYGALRRAGRHTDSGLRHRRDRRGDERAPVEPGRRPARGGERGGDRPRVPAGDGGPAGRGPGRDRVRPQRHPAHVRLLAHPVQASSPGDEVVVSRLDHDANIRPWVQAAERAGAVVRWADFDPATGELSPRPSARRSPGGPGWSR